MTVTDAATKRHKHKHKCGEELCKHRKHKKRRKHRKHHHRAESTPTDGQSEEQPAKSDELNGTESDAHMDDEHDSVDSMEMAAHASSAKESLRALAARNITAKKVNIKLNRVQWPTDEDIASSITEDSSGSSYVSGQFAGIRWNSFPQPLPLSLSTTYSGNISCINRIQSK